MIQISSENSNIFKELLEGKKKKQMLINLITNIIDLKIKDIKYESIRKFENISEYEFSATKTICELENSDSIDVYLKIIKKDKIKESIFCYWCLLYEQELREYKEKITMSTIINKVQISEVGMERYKNSVFLQIQNNKTDILKYGTEVHFIDLKNYVENNKNEQNKLGEWLKYLEENNNDILMIGVVLNKNIKRKNI